MPKVDVKKLQNGEAAKKQILQEEYPSTNTYQRLKNIREMLSRVEGVITIGKGPKGARLALINTINETLDMIRPFYEKDGNGLIRISEGGGAIDQARKMAEINVMFTETLKKAVDDYHDHLRQSKDKEASAVDNYKKEKPSESYIYRHVAIDELNDILEMSKSIVKNYGLNSSLLAMDNIKSYTFEDIMEGLEKKQKEAMVPGAVRERADHKVLDTQKIFQGFAASGNLEASSAYHALKDLDLSVYYTELTGGGFQNLDPEKISELKRVADRIKSITSKVMEAVKNAGKDVEKLNDALIPETKGADQKYPAYANAYRSKLVTAFKELDTLADTIYERMDEASKHPEYYTLPLTLRGAGDDSFLGKDSLNAQMAKLAEVIAVPMSQDDIKAKRGEETAAEARSNISTEVQAVVESIHVFFEIGDDGYYPETSHLQLAELDQKYEALERAIAANEDALKKNVPSVMTEQTENALRELKNIANRHRQLLTQAVKDSMEYPDGSLENSNLTLAELLDPNPEIRNRLKQLREERISSKYAQEKAYRDERLRDPELDALQITELRLRSITEDRFLASNAQRAAYRELIEKNRAVYNKLKLFYRNDGFGGFTHFASEVEKREFVQQMKEAQDEIAKVLKEKKKVLPQQFVESLTATSDLFRTYSDTLNKAFIAGKASIAGFLDAGKFGHPGLEQAYRNAQGFDRFDWSETDQKNDQETVMYANYRNPIQKIREDLEVFTNRSKNPYNHFGDAERKWLEQFTNFMRDNFGPDFIDKYYTETETYDKIFKKTVKHYPLLSKADQDKLHANFVKMRDMIDQISETPEYRNLQNPSFQGLLVGLGTFARNTAQRLEEFNPALDVTVFTIQEAISGRADTTSYNFRNELERFNRMHSLPDMAYKLTKAGIIVSEGKKYDVKEDGSRERKQVNKASWLTTILTLGRYKDMEFVTDYNDLMANLELIREFENDYFRIGMDGEYRDIPRDYKDKMGDPVLKKKIRTIEQLEHVYQQIEELSINAYTKAADYNKDKDPEDQIPAEYLNALKDIYERVKPVHSLVAQDQGKETKPEYTNVMEMIHSDPIKRENMWKIRQNGIFHRHHVEEGQIGSYHDLEHFQYTYGEDKTYNGRFYDKAEIPPKDTLDGKLTGVLNTMQDVSEEGRAFAEQLIQEIAADPDAMSRYLPTIGDIKRSREPKYLEGRPEDPKVIDQTAMEAQAKALLSDAVTDGKLGEYEWWKNENDRKAVEEVLSRAASYGINHADYEARAKKKVAYGEDLTLHALMISKLSEHFGIDSGNTTPDKRIIPKASFDTITVPGEEQKTYKGIMVNKVPDYVLGVNYNEIVNGVAQNQRYHVVTGKELLTDDKDPQYFQNLSIQQFNNPENLKALAQLQLLCYLCNAPLPKMEDLKFAVTPTDAAGTRKIRLMPYMPDPAFLPDEKFEGQVKLEDLTVIPMMAGNQISNLYHKKDSKMRENCENTAKNLLAGIGLSETTIDRMSKVVAGKLMKMSKFIHDEKKAPRSVIGNDAEHMYAGIKEKQILLTDDFAHLTVDKLARKHSIFESKMEGRNIFTEISEIPERAYTIRTKMKGALDTGEKNYHIKDNFRRMVSRLNAEAGLADFQDRSEEYLVHRWFQKDSEEAKNLMNIMKAMVNFEKTGILEYHSRTRNIGPIGLHIDPMGVTPEQSDAMRTFVVEAQAVAQKYIDERDGIIGPIRSFGKQRLKAAKLMDELLRGSIAEFNAAENQGLNNPSDPLEEVRLEMVNPKLAGQFKEERMADIRNREAYANEPPQQQQPQPQREERKSVKVNLLKEDQKEREANKNVHERKKADEPKAVKEVPQKKSGKK